MDSRDPILVGGKDSLSKDFTEIFKEFYPGAAEELDMNFPKALIDEILIIYFILQHRLVLDFPIQIQKNTSILICMVI